MILIQIQITRLKTIICWIVLSITHFIGKAGHAAFTLCHQRMYHYARTYPLRYLQLIATDTVIAAMQIASLRI